MFNTYLHILIILISIIVIYFIIDFVYFMFFYKLHLSTKIVKYKMSDSDKKFMKLKSIKSELDNLDPNGINVFYTESNWSIKNNNYILFNGKYYIIEPGYYYYVKKNDLTINNKNMSIKLFVKK